MALDTIEAIHIATVFEDCVDQLAVLGRIMPVSYEDRGDADEVNEYGSTTSSKNEAIVDDDIAHIVNEQKNLEARYEQVLENKQDRGANKVSHDKRQAVKADVKVAGADLKNNTHLFARSLKQNPLTPDNLEKVQKDRLFLQAILQSTMLELTNKGSFTHLSEAVRSEKHKKANLQETILKEEDGRKKVRALQKKILDVRRDKEIELQERSEMIAHLKDQLQEMKAKTNMEEKYIKKCADVSVAQTQKRCTLTEQEMKQQTAQLTQQLDEETRVNTEIESYLRAHQADLEAKVEYWMDKYDKDVEKMQHDLDVLKASKAKDLERLQELTKLYAEYEQVVVEDRIEKEKKRRKEEQEQEELRAAIRLQAWFRGVMVRKGLGPYNKKKKKKGGKKGKGKKKKK